MSNHFFSKKNRKYKIARKIVGWLIIQSIFFLGCCSTIHWNFWPLLFVIILYSFIVIIQFSIFYRIKEEVTSSSNSSSIYSHENIELHEKYKTLLKHCRNIDKLSKFDPKLHKDISILEIPVLPKKEKEDNLIEYVTKLKSLHNNNHMMSGFEQFILSIHPNEELIDFTHYLMKYLKNESSELLSKSYLDFCNFITNTTNNINNFIHLENGIWEKFFTNLTKELLDHFQSKLELHQFSEDIASSKFAKSFGPDFIKAGLQTFPDFNSLHNIENHIKEFVHEVNTNIHENAPSWNILQPDFDFTAHVPYITIAVEAFRQIKKLVNDKTDYKAAAKNWSIKVGYKTVGVTIGSVIGTAILPGLGTMLGGMLGVILGGEASNEVIREDFDEAVSEYKKYLKEFNRLKKEAKIHLEESQREVEITIQNKAQKERKIFNERKVNCPITDSFPISIVYSTNILIQQYLFDFYHSLLKDIKNNNSDVNDLKNGKCKELSKYLKSTIPKIKDIEIAPIVSLERMLNVLMVIDINRAHLEQFNTVKEQIQYSDIVSDITKQVEDTLSSYYMLLFLYYYHTYTAYYKAINRLTKKIEILFEELENQTKLKKEHLQKMIDKIKKQKSKVEKELAKIN